MEHDADTHSLQGLRGPMQGRIDTIGQKTSWLFVPSTVSKRIGLHQSEFLVKGDSGKYSFSPSPQVFPQLNDEIPLGIARAESDQP